MNKLVNFKDNGNTLISKQSAGCDFSNEIAYFSSESTPNYWTATEDCWLIGLIRNTYASISVDNVGIAGQVSTVYCQMLIKKGQRIVANYSGSGAGGGAHVNCYGIKYL